MKNACKHICVLLITLVITLAAVCGLAPAVLAGEVEHSAYALNHTPGSLTGAPYEDRLDDIDGVDTTEFTAVGILIISTACLLILSNCKKKV